MPAHRKFLWSAAPMDIAARITREGAQTVNRSLQGARGNTLRMADSEPQLHWRGAQEVQNCLHQAASIGTGERISL
ncbi:homeobox protein Hox-C4 isoform X4 [Bufo bufo]|uniref:homeobox protein Hox-C4 isoform X4 n=1 Tax=Bufo bufo TaxID=8384 RepID=UPI001ABDF970|nr:homeobox protein Hox-C4 isoform X4 [Bufo bufo]